MTQLTCSIFLTITCDRNNRLHPQIIPSSLFFDAEDYIGLFIAISPDRPSYALLHILNTVNQVVGESVLMHSASEALHVALNGDGRHAMAARDEPENDLLQLLAVKGNLESGEALHEAEDCIHVLAAEQLSRPPRNV